MPLYFICSGVEQSVPPEDKKQYFMFSFTYLAQGMGSINSVSIILWTPTTEDKSLVKNSSTTLATRYCGELNYSTKLHRFTTADLQ